MREQIERLWRRLQLVIGRGRIRVVDDSTPAQTLQVQLGADETKDALPRIAEYGFTSNPPPGTDAVVIFLAGERTNGVVVATNNQQFRMRNLETGEVAIYDNRGRFVLLGAGGIHVQGNADPILVETTGTITANAGGDINATSSGGAVNVTAAASIKLEAPFIHLKGSSIVLEAPGVGIDASILDGQRRDDDERRHRHQRRHHGDWCDGGDGRDDEQRPRHRPGPQAPRPARSRRTPPPSRALRVLSRHERHRDHLERLARRLAAGRRRAGGRQRPGDGRADLAVHRPRRDDRRRDPRRHR
jgi:phage baseplate assembly protein V